MFRDEQGNLVGWERHHELPELDVGILVGLEHWLGLRDQRFRELRRRFFGVLRLGSAILYRLHGGAVRDQGSLRGDGHQLHDHFPD